MAAFLFHQIILYNFFPYIKRSKNQLAKYYENNKERLQKKARKTLFSKEQKEKKQQYGREQLKNLPDEKLFEYRKKYYIK